MAADPTATHYRIGEAKRTDEGVGSTTFGGSLSLLEIFYGMSFFFLELEKYEICNAIIIYIHDIQMNIYIYFIYTYS